MADKSFEQQIKEQLADLRMLPDAAVWVDVAAALHKERKRRWLIWLFLLLAGCGGASFWAYYQFNKPGQQLSTTGKQTAIVTKERPAEKQTAPVEAIPGDKKVKVEKNKTERPLSAVKASHGKTDHVQSGMVTVGKMNTLSERPIVTVVNDPLAGKYDHTARTGQTPATADTPAINKIPVDQSYSVTAPTVTPSGIDTTALSVNNETNKPGSVGYVKETQASGITFHSGDTMQPVVTKIKKNKWEWDLGVNTGTSGIRRSMGLSIFNDKYASDAASSTAPGNVLGNPAQSQSQYKTPAINDAFSFSVNLQAKKQAGKKHSIGVSLGYGLYQSTIDIGSRVDSTLFISSYGVYNSNGLYYRNTNTGSYTNRYHFLQAAVDLYTPFRLFKTVSLRWQLGTGLNVLISGNGLHYSNDNNLLFSNRSLLRTLQADVSTGLDVAIGKQPFLYIGPQWQYFISNLSRQTGANQHFLRSAVKLTIVLPKNKKIKMQR